MVQRGWMKHQQEVTFRAISIHHFLCMIKDAVRAENTYGDDRCYTELLLDKACSTVSFQPSTEHAGRVSVKGARVVVRLVDIVEPGDIVADDLLYVRCRNALKRLRDQVLGVRPGGVGVRIV